MLKQRIKTAKGSIKRNSGLIANFGYLSILQVYSTLVPLITYPYLVKVLGTEVYGLVIFAQTVAIILSNIVDYGFDISGVKQVAENKQNKDKLSEIVSSIYIIKFILWLLTFVIIIGMITLIPKFSSEPLLYIFSFAILFNNLLFPQWLFQGLEKMRYITIINIISRTIFLILIFIFVKTVDDYVFVPLLTGVGAFIGGIISVYFVIKNERIRLRIQPMKVLLHYFKEGSSMFGFRMAGVIKTQSNQIILGFLANYSLVTYYDLAMKITSVFSIVFNNYSAVFFPNIAKTKNITLGKKALKLSALLSTGIFLLIAILLNPIIQWWNPEFLPTVRLFWIVGFFIPVYAIASFLGNSFLVAHGFQVQHLYSTAWTTLVYLASIYILFVTNSITIYSLAFVILGSQLLSTIHKFYYCKKYNLL